MHLKFLGGSWLILARICTFALGALAVGWACCSIPAYLAESEFANAAHDILLGARFNSAQLRVLQRDVSAITVGSLRSLALMDIAVVRLRVLDGELMSGNAQDTELEDLQTAVDVALAEIPSSSFLWLVECWLDGRRTRSSGRAFQFLRMSYWSGSNEGWIATRRNQLALQIFPVLPDELQQQVLLEFRGLVRSGFYVDAANVLAGPGWPIREKLLEGLAGLSEVDRRNFAKVLESKDLEDVAIPGLEKRSSRPF